MVRVLILKFFWELDVDKVIFFLYVVDVFIFFIVFSGINFMYLYFSSVFIEKICFGYCEVSKLWEFCIFIGKDDVVGWN